jgi:signal transduction histidine kinase
VELPVPAPVLSIVVGNLVENALVHGQRGRVEVTLRSDGVTVRDEGPGIGGEELPHVFDRSFRGRSAAAGGSGLGLAIARRLADHVGWTLSLESVRDRGTIARVAWPLA